MRYIIEYFLDKSMFLNLFSTLLVVVGTYKAMTMNREAFPIVDFDIVTVTCVYPGASPEEVEKLISKPIEDGLKTVDGIKEIRSTSIENRSGIVVFIDPNTKNSKKVVDDIKNAVELVNTLPEDAKKPIVQEITSGRTPVIEISVGVKNENGKSFLTERQLKDKVKILEDMILDISEVGRVVRRGDRLAEMHVELKPEAMLNFMLSPSQVVNALKTKNINFPGGLLTTGGKESIVRTIGEFYKPEEVEKVFIRSNDVGRFVTVKDIANVKEDFEDAQYVERVNGLNAVVLTVIKKENTDAIRLVDKVKEEVKKFEKLNESSISISYVNDMSFFVRRRLDVLVSNGVTGFFLVVSSLFFFLGWRVSLMVALGLPLAVAITFIVLSLIGVSLNLISMMGLIIVVGMLVDDAIVISENIYRYIEEGYDVREACIKGTEEVIYAVTATITTTIASFAPLLFMTGIFGKFIYTIPLVVIVSLLSSLFEAFFILPSHVNDITGDKKVSVSLNHEGKLFEKFKRIFYLSTLKFALRFKYLTMIFFIFTLVASVGLLMKMGRFKLFPGGIDAFQIKIEAQTGLTLDETLKYAQAIEREIAKLPKDELENYTTRIGIIQKDPNDPSTKRGKHYGQIIVYLTPEENRKRITEDVINVLRKKTIWLLNEEQVKIVIEKEKEQIKIMNDKKIRIPKSMTLDIKPEIPDDLAFLKGKLVLLDFQKLQGGPPVGKPVNVEVVGDDYDTLKKIIAEYKQIMGKVPGVIDIGDDYMEGKDEYRIKINEQLAAQAGVNVFQIATTINTAYQGAIATKIKKTDEEIEVRVRLPEEYRKSMKSLDNLYVNNLAQNLIPISKLVSYEKSPGFATITHLDGRRLLSATANIDENQTTSRSANLELTRLAAGIIEKYPGYRVRFGGENKDTEESMLSLGKAFFVAFVFIFMLLASLFSSFFQPLIVVSAIPFSFIGVIIAFITHGHYFSFLSMIGIVGLSGVVVNDSIVLVDFANQLRKEKPHLSSLELLMEVGAVRLRPVILTTVTTVFGVLPTAYGIGGSDPFLIPMALAIGWGLAFATLLTLILIPVQYKIYMDVQDSFRRLVERFSKKKPTLPMDDTTNKDIIEVV